MYCTMIIYVSQILDLGVFNLKLRVIDNFECLIFMGMHMLILPIYKDCLVFELRYCFSLRHILSLSLYIYTQQV